MTINKSNIDIYNQLRGTGSLAQLIRCFLSERSSSHYDIFPPFHSNRVILVRFIVRVISFFTKSQHIFLNPIYLTHLTQFFLTFVPKKRLHYYGTEGVD